MDLCEETYKLACDVLNIEEKIIDTAIRRCLIVNNLKISDVILLMPENKYTGKYYLMKKSDDMKMNGKYDLTKAFCLGGFKHDFEKGEILWQNY